MQEGTVFKTGHYYFACCSRETPVGLRAFSLSSRDWSSGRGGMAGGMKQRTCACLAAKRQTSSGVSNKRSVGGVGSELACGKK